MNVVRQCSQSEQSGYKRADISLLELSIRKASHARGGAEFLSFELLNLVRGTL